MGRIWTGPPQRVETAHEPRTDWRRTLKRRTTVAAAVLALWAGGIECRLVYLQIVARPDLVARAERQHSRTIDAPAKRGDIFDRRGRILATSADADSIYVVPSEIEEPAAAVAKLCEALSDCTDRERRTLVDRLSRNRAFSYVRRFVSPDVARRIAALNLDGIGFMKESRRFYPKKELAAHVLGYVGTDNKGLSGVEFAYDSQIRGQSGAVLVHADARRHVFSRIERPPTAGSSIELTIDEYLQHVTERELQAGVVRHRAAAGTAIVMDPQTGEILAMASVPTFNPNVYGRFSDAARRNRAVQDLYEPGSTFKIVTASAAIAEKVVPLDAQIDTSPGVIRIGRRVVDEYRGHDYGVLSFTDVIVKSSNVGAVKIGLKLGRERLSQYVERFGFGRPLSPDFPGESPGIVWGVDTWNDSAIASVSMGYQVGVTPLQMVTAIGAVANGGNLLQPRVVRAIYLDGRRYPVNPKVLRRVIEPDTAAVLTTIMEKVVEEGTAQLSKLSGYGVAGKTGTASKLIDGRYSASENNVSFVGYVPSRNPVAVIVVVIDTPHVNGNTGGAVAAPIFKGIAEATVRYLGVRSNVDPVPPVLVARRVPEHLLSASASRPRPELVADHPAGTIPDLRGLSARDATRELVVRGLAVRMSGDGVVLAQRPTAGAAAQPGDVCELVLGRQVNWLAPDTAFP